MQEIGHNVLGTSISMHLAGLLKANWRLPAPLNCPPKVRFLCAVEIGWLSDCYYCKSMRPLVKCRSVGQTICNLTHITVIGTPGVQFDEAVLGVRLWWAALFLQPWKPNRNHHPGWKRESQRLTRSSVTARGGTHDLWQHHERMQ